MLFALLLAAAFQASDYKHLVEADRRLVEVGRRLARGGAELCDGKVSNPGWTLADIEQYQTEARPAVKTALALGDLPQVMAVQPDSAAARAGVQPGDSIVIVDGKNVSPVAQRRPGRARLSLIEREAPLASARLIRNGSERSVTLVPEPGCTSHFLIGRATGLRGVSSDGRQVGISTEMLGYVANDDELALVLAHELAHNILGHNKGMPATRKAGGDRSGRSKKGREAEADRWALYLMARAGFDVTVAPAFWRRWGPKTSFGIFNAGTHPDWRDRATAAEAELGKIRADLAAGRQPVP